MTEIPAIYSDLAAVMRSVGHVDKGDRNNHSNYNFRGIDAVLSAVGPALREHQVVVVPELIGDPLYEEVQTSGGKKSTACRVKVSYLFYSAKDGSMVAATVAAEAWDTGDKAMPKAMSVAFRTALIQALALPTDEPDPDSFTYTREARDGKVENLRRSLESVTTLDGLRSVWSDANAAGVLDQVNPHIEAKRNEIERAQSNG